MVALFLPALARLYLRGEAVHTELTGDAAAAHAGRLRRAFERAGGDRRGADTGTRGADELAGRWPGSASSYRVTALAVNRAVARNRDAAPAIKTILCAEPKYIRVRAGVSSPTVAQSGHNEDWVERAGAPRLVGDPADHRDHEYGAPPRGARRHHRPQGAVPGAAGYGSGEAGWILVHRNTLSSPTSAIRSSGSRGARAPM